jgi:hypothetical protein
MNAGFNKSGGEGGIRTLGTGVSPYNGLANRRIRPLCHLSVLYLRRQRRNYLAISGYANAHRSANAARNDSC